MSWPYGIASFREQDRGWGREVWAGVTPSWSKVSVLGHSEKDSRWEDKLNEGKGV